MHTFTRESTTNNAGFNNEGHTQVETNNIGLGLVNLNVPGVVSDNDSVDIAD
jgi:hypothetical protein